MSKIIFLHIPKTAGSALRNALASQFDEADILPVPDDYKEHEPEYPVAEDTPSYGYQMTLTKRKVKPYSLIMGHYDWNLVNKLGDGWQVVTLLRHPVRQLISLYEYYRGTPDADRDGSHELCSRLSFREWLDTEHGHMRLNQACQTLSGRRNGVSVDFDTARANLLNTAFGVVEVMDVSLNRINDATGLQLPPTLDRVNPSPVQAETIELDAETMALVRHNQRFDLMLYELAITRMLGGA